MKLKSTIYNTKSNIPVDCLNYVHLYFSDIFQWLPYISVNFNSLSPQIVGFCLDRVVESTFHKCQSYQTLTKITSFRDLNLYIYGLYVPKKSNTFIILIFHNICNFFWYDFDISVYNIHFVEKYSGHSASDIFFVSEWNLDLHHKFRYLLPSQQLNQKVSPIGWNGLIEEPPGPPQQDCDLRGLGRRHQGRFFSQVKRWEFQFVN